MYFKLLRDFRPRLASYEQTVQENIKMAHSRQERGRPRGKGRVMSEQSVITTSDALHREQISWISTHQSRTHL